MRLLNWQRLRKCGKRHLHCKVCRPGIGKKVGRSLVGNLSPFRGAAHTTEAKQKIRSANIGKKLSAETKQRISRASKNHWKDPEYQRKMEVARKKHYSPTSLEYALQLLLESARLEYEAQVRFGRYTVDFFVPSRNLVFEADGEPWHSWNEKKSPGYHGRRDFFLLTKVTSVVHLTGHDLLSWLVA